MAVLRFALEVRDHARTAYRPESSRFEVAGLPAQRGGDQLPRGGLDLGQVVGPPEGLGVDLVDVLGPRGPGGEPRGLRRHLEPADLGAVAWGRGQLRGDRLAG